MKGCKRFGSNLVKMSAMMLKFFALELLPALQN